MGIRELLITRKDNYQAKKEIVSQRISKAEEVYKTTKSWLAELGVLDILTIEDKIWENDYNIPENTYIIKGYGIGIWIRHVKDPEIMQIMIGNSTISFKDNKWYYKDGKNEKEFNKDVFEEILIKEISDNSEYY